jgi:hypothetical protein
MRLVRDQLRTPLDLPGKFPGHVAIRVRANAEDPKLAG